MDAISIIGLIATGFRGALPEKRLDSQWFVVNVRSGLHVETRSDELSDAVDYVGIADLIRAEIEDEPYRLIETLAGRIADRCLPNSLVQQVCVTVHKPQTPAPHESSDLSVAITRSSHEQWSL